MSEQKVRVKQEGFIAVITVDNPPVNTLNQEVIDGLDSVFDGLLYKNDIRAVVITGAGEKAFMAGADISQFLALDQVSGWNFVQNWINVFQKVADFPAPVIAAINGVALGGGLELALACDIRVAAENAKLGVPEVGLGIIPGVGGTQRLPRTVGLGYAKKMIFTGEPIPAAEALRIGLVDQTTPPGAAFDEAFKLAEKIAAKGPLAVRTAKQVIREGIKGSLLDGLRLESDGIALLFATEDKAEGVNAFFEKRPANFTGK